jgi:hypothetical protein
MSHVKVRALLSIRVSAIRVPGGTGIPGIHVPQGPSIVARRFNAGPRDRDRDVSRRDT